MSDTPGNFPLAESIGIFLGISGVDWLARGYAEPLKAAAIALACGSAGYAWRRWRQRGAGRHDRTAGN